MFKRPTKVVGVSLTFKIFDEIKKIAPAIGAKTPAEACRNIVLSYLRFQGTDIPDSLFLRQKRRDYETPAGQKRMRKNIAHARAIKAERKRVADTLEEIRAKKLVDGKLKAKVRQSTKRSKSSRRAA